MPFAILAVVDGSCSRCGTPYSIGDTVVRYGQGYRHHPTCDTTTPRQTNAQAKRTGNYSRPHHNNNGALIPEFEPPGPWIQDAACLDADPDLFFPVRNPDGDGERNVGSYARARAICAACPVATECLDHAMRVEEDGKRFGMWAGTTPNDRRELAGQRAVGRAS